VTALPPQPTTRVPLFRTAIGEEAVEAAAEVLRSGWIGSGPIVEQFEGEFGTLVDAPHCLAVSSGTAALHLALRALDLEPGTEVITTPLTWLSTHHVILYQGCVPVFADLDPATGNLDPSAVADKLTERTGAILAVHYGGYPCDLRALRSLADDAGVALVEDCAHAVGASYDGRPIGSAANLQCFSFSPTKNLTCADGGAVVTGDPLQAERLRRLRSLGIERTAARRMREDGWPYRDRHEILEAGFRYEMNELHAAIGLAQLPSLAAENDRRRQIAAAYRAGLGDVPGIELLQADTDERQSSHHLFAVLVEDRERLAGALRSRGVEVGVHYPVNELLRTPPGELPQMDRFAEQTLSLPIHPSLTDGDVATVIAAVREGW
jgi:dTDP-4-amino-4,6-dideoxygalactose transaminase